jgi:hypothetical protein
MADKSSNQEKARKVIDTITGKVVFTGTLDECTQKVVSDASGFLELAP